MTTRKLIPSNVYGAPKLDQAELEVIKIIDDLRQMLRNRVSQSRRWTGSLARVTFARNIRGSNSVEGYNVTVDDALAAVEGEEPLDASQETWLAVTSYRKAMTYVLQRADDKFFSYDVELFRGLHFMMIDYDLTKHPGKWRTGAVYVRNEKDEIVYEPPDVERVPDLMTELVEILNHQPTVPMIIRAAMGHLNLTLVHPFVDGNGRMARCLQTLILARDGILAPVFSSIEEYIGRNRQDYYNALQETAQGRWSPHDKTHAWIKFCLTAHYRQAVTLLKRMREMERLWSELEILIQKSGFPDRTIIPLSDASMGFQVRNPIYRKQAEISEAVAGRDLKALVQVGHLIPVGEKRGRHYKASDNLKALRQSLRERSQNIPDPFTADRNLISSPSEPRQLSPQ